MAVDFVGDGLCGDGVLFVVCRTDFDATSQGSNHYGNRGNGRFVAYCFSYPVATQPIARAIANKYGVRASPQPNATAITHAHSDTNGGATYCHSIAQSIAHAVARNVCGAATR